MSPSPSQSLATLRPDLAGAFMEFDLEMDRKGFIGLHLFPVIEVGLQADNPGRVPLEELLQVEPTLRASGSTYKRGSFTFTKWQYATEENAREEPLDQRDVKRYRHLIDAETVAAQRALDKVLRGQEKRIADALTDVSANGWTTGNAALQTVAATVWSNPAADIIGDVEAAVRQVFNQTGIWPDTLAINKFAFRDMRNNDGILDRIASSGAGSSIKAANVTTAQIAEVLDLPKILVAGSATNTAAQGQPRAVAPLWANDFAMVCKTSDSNDHREPCLGRTFHWGEDGSSIGGTIEQYWEEQSRSDIYRVRHDTDEVIMYRELGHRIVIG